MEELLGKERYERADDKPYKNYRNGYSEKNIKNRFGNVEIDIQIDRNAKFEPKIAKKYEAVCNEPNNKIVTEAAYICMVFDINGRKDILG